MIPNFSLSRGIERLHNMPHDPQGAAYDYRTVEAASLLSLPITGVELKEKSVDDMILNLARVAEEYGLDPEGVQQVLFAHEPGLALNAKAQND